MKKLLLILIALPMIGCQQKVEEYKESNVIQVDTLVIESVKIETH
ncbi:MAG: hypothetical protein ACI8ZH_000192 [Flavobacteriales bacterium]|jgi:hypothetical protein